jgi:uncharacterized protein YjbI with pentapeptide repeats
MSATKRPVVSIGAGRIPPDGEGRTMAAAGRVAAHTVAGMAGKPAGRRRAPQVGAHLSSSADDFLIDDADMTGVRLTGDHGGRTASLVQLAGCRVEGAQLVGTHLVGSRLVDCVVVGCDLSGLVLEDSACTRVEFRDCRLSGLQAASCRFADVGFLRCRLDGANFRMTTWERAEFHDCDLVDADFYAATLPASRFIRCDLTGVELSRCTLTAATLQWSDLSALRGAESLRGVTISGDQVLPAALALFAAMAMTLDDEPPL